MTTLLTDIWRYSLPDDDPMHLDMSPVQLDAHDSQLQRWAQYAPDLVDGVIGALESHYGFTPVQPPGGSDGGYNSAAAEVFNRITGAVSSSQERTNRTQTTDRETTEGINRTGTSEFHRTTGRRETRFIDVPTPEEFLNDFQNGSTTYLRGLLSEGVVDRETVDFLMDNPDLLFDGYLADLGARAARGEDIFRVVGTENEIERLGERLGESFTEEYSGFTRDQIYEQIVSTQKDKIMEEVRTQFSEQQTQTDSAGNALPFTTEQEQQIMEETNRRLNEITNRLVNEQIEQSGSMTQLTVEEMIARPKLATVFKISPLSYLQSQYTPQSLMNLAAGRRGTEQRRRDTATGSTPVAPRRVGG